MRLFIYILLITCTVGFSQKKTEQVITIDEAVTHLMFDLDNVFTIKISTSKSNQVVIKAVSEGEYANHFVITKKQQSHSLTIKGAIAFTFQNKQDKLSTHKVHAIVVEIIIPEHLQTTVSSDIGNVSIKGVHSTLTTDLLSGDCYLNNPSGNFEIKTVTGEINLVAKNGVISAESKSGTIFQEKIPNGNSTFDLKTAKGNINIAKGK